MEEQFRTTILQSPDDDEARLVYADWLDDQGEHDRAELIRVQCQIASLENPNAAEGDGPRDVEAKLIAANINHWTAPLAKLGDIHATSIGFHRGFIETFNGHLLDRDLHVPLRDRRPHWNEAPIAAILEATPMLRSVDGIVLGRPPEAHQELLQLPQLSQLTSLRTAGRVKEYGKALAGCSHTVVRSISVGAGDPGSIRAWQRFFPLTRQIRSLRWAHPNNAAVRGEWPLLEELVFRFRFAGDSDAEELDKWQVLSQLKSLEIDVAIPYQPSVVDFRPLRNCSQLERLHLNMGWSQVSQPTRLLAQPVEAMNKLRHFSLRMVNRNVSAELIDSLSQLPHLESLTLREAKNSYPGESESESDYLSLFRTEFPVKHLDVGSMWVASAAEFSQRNHQHVESLSLTGTQDLAGNLRAIASVTWPRLRSLSLASLHIKASSLRAIAAATPNLRELRLQNVIWDYDDAFSVVAKHGHWPHLRRLRAPTELSAAELLSIIAAWGPQLHHLELGSPPKEKEAEVATALVNAELPFLFHLALPKWHWRTWPQLSGHFGARLRMPT